MELRLSTSTEIIALFCSFICIRLEIEIANYDSDDSTVREKQTHNFYYDFNDQLFVDAWMTFKCYLLQGLIQSIYQQEANDASRIKFLRS